MWRVAEHRSARSTDLAGHTIIAASGIAPTPEWRFNESGRTMAIKVRPRLSTTTSDSAIEAALAGFGITRLMSYQVAQHVREGRLEIVLSDCEGAALPVHLVNREGRHVAPKVRVFIDLASAALPTDDSLNDALLG